MTFSDDGLWWGDRDSWKPALSEDGRWRWNGTRWETVGVVASRAGERRGRVWEAARRPPPPAQEGGTQRSDQAAAKVSELKSKAQRSPPSTATVSGPYDTGTAGTAGSREETETKEVPVRYRAYEG